MCAHFSYSALASSTALKNSSIPIPISEDTPTAWERGRGSDEGMEAGRSRGREREMGKEKVKEGERGRGKLRQSEKDEERGEGGRNGVQQRREGIIQLGTYVL